VNSPDIEKATGAGYEVDGFSIRRPARVIVPVLAVGDARPRNTRRGYHEQRGFRVRRVSRPSGSDLSHNSIRLEHRAGSAQRRDSLIHEQSDQADFSRKPSFGSPPASNSALSPDFSYWLSRVRAYISSVPASRSKSGASVGSRPSQPLAYHPIFRNSFRSTIRSSSPPEMGTR
jgi:hypothetical protein